MEIKTLKYAIHLDEEKRIDGFTYEQRADDSYIIVNTLPDGDPTDYKYINGKYVYDPEQKPDPPEPQPTLEERMDAAESSIDYLAMMTDIEIPTEA